METVTTGKRYTRYYLSIRKMAVLPRETVTTGKRFTKYYLSIRQMAVLPRETVTTGKRYCTTRMMARGMLSTWPSLFTYQTWIN